MGAKGAGPNAWGEGLDDLDVAEGDTSGFVPAGAGELRRLAAGEITAEEYVEHSVQRATAHLEGRLSSEKLEVMRDILRVELSEDPLVADLTESLGAAS